MTYTLFSGCSLTAGSGFADEKNNPSLWVNQLHNRLFSHTTKLNVSKAARSNAGIFQDTVSALTLYPVQYAIVQWTSLVRYNMELGFELYDTSHSVITNCSAPWGHNLNDISYSAEYLGKIRDRFTMLPHPVFEIVTVLDYVNSIIRLARLTNTRVFFINGYLPWDTDFFVKKINVKPGEYTNYTQKILNCKNRDDIEIFKLYEKLHNRFDDTGNVNQSYWLNLYESMIHHRIDVNNDGLHPGVNSNLRYVDFFTEAITKKL
jgi:hypothetical protein